MKKRIGVLLVLTLIFTGGCTPTKIIEEDVPPVVEGAIDENEQEVNLYFANIKYVETGDEELEKMFPEKRLIEYGEISLEERIVRELMEGPEDTENLSTVIPPDVKLIGVEVSEGTAFVNFSQEDMAGGSMQEMFTIDQIVNSLTELDSVERVQFLIDGEVAESLMGHVFIDEAFEATNE